jgi:LuxR family maltose regulon positive regulatory protein
MAEAQQLRIASAESYYLDGLRLAEQHVGPHSVAAALAASFISRIRYEQGRLDEAEAMLADRVSLINAGTMLDCVLSAYFVMARIAAHRMNSARAHTLLEWAENQGNTRAWGRLSAAAVLERMRLYLNEGRLDQATECLHRLEQLAAEYPAPTNCAWSDIHRYAALARAYLASAEERFDDAISILDGLRRELENAHNIHFALRVEIHLAVARFRANQAPEALKSFGAVVSAFARAGIYQTILDDGGPEIGSLLDIFQENAERMGSSQELTSYVSKLIGAWKSRYQTELQQTSTPMASSAISEPTSAISDSTSAISEPLSTREGVILKLIAEGLSNKEIARNLAITPETVKSHVKHIFTKLNVEKRAQAVSRAQILGLADTQH